MGGDFADPLAESEDKYESSEERQGIESSNLSITDTKCGLGLTVLCGCGVCPRARGRVRLILGKSLHISTVVDD